MSSNALEYLRKSDGEISSTDWLIGWTDVFPSLFWSPSSFYFSFKSLFFLFLFQISLLSISLSLLFFLLLFQFLFFLLMLQFLFSSLIFSFFFLFSRLFSKLLSLSTVAIAIFHPLLLFHNDLVYVRLFLKIDF